MVIRNPPRTWIDVQARLEFAFLAEPAKLGVLVAAAQRPRTPARALVVFEYFDFVAGAAQLVRGDEAGHARTEDQDRGIGRRVRQLDRTVIAGFAREPERRHRLVHHRGARALADAFQQFAPADQTIAFVAMHMLLRSRGRQYAQNLSSVGRAKAELLKRLLAPRRRLEPAMIGGFRAPGLGTRRNILEITRKVPQV